MKDRLLRENELTMVRAIEVCKDSEISRQQLKEFDDKASVSVNGVNQKPRKNKDVCKQITNSNFCRSNHQYGKCLACGKTCRKFNGRNHIGLPEARSY